MNDAADFCDEANGRIERALDVIYEFGGIDGAHHKQWVLDQVVRVLSEDYAAWCAEKRASDHEWDEGIAP
jgi:hypothetical protein